MGDQDTGSPGRPVPSGLQVAGEQEHCRARTRPRSRGGYVYIDLEWKWMRTDVVLQTVGRTVRLKASFEVSIGYV